MAAQKDQFVTKKGVEQIKPKYGSQQTLQYKTFLKRTMVEALQDGFSEYEDPTLKKTKIGIDYTTDRADFPSIVVKFYGKTLKNAGVGHIEWINTEKEPGVYTAYHHTMYQGDISFEVYGLSSLDRDVVTDAIVEVVQMIYDTIGKSPYSESHFITVNTDLLSEYGETQTIAPWIPEDTFVYQCEYRVPIFGEFYSKTPNIPGTSLVGEVDIYPWDETDTAVTPDPEEFPGGVVPEEDYIKIT